MSNSTPHMTDDLLVKHLLGEATIEEQEQVQAWCNAAEENRRYYDQFKKLWDQSLKIAGTRLVDEDAAFIRLQNRINNNQATSKTQTRRLNRANWLAIAASVVLVCMLSYWGLNYFSRVTIINLQSNNKVLVDTLSDGSVVTMNALSQLSYPNRFSGDTRAVYLSGEAFFKITPDKTKPFIINVNGVTVRVVGTSFNVKSRNGKTEVIVETGIVNVNRDKNSISLKPGEKTVVLKSGNSLTKQSTRGKLYSYYINKELVCDSTPLSELVAALNEIYGAHIVIAKPSLNKLPITTVFKNQSLEQILLVVTGTFPITAVHKSNQIILK